MTLLKTCEKRGLCKRGSSTTVVLQVRIASPGSLLEIQVIRLHPDLQKHEV